MSENDKDPRPGEFTDPTASPDWTPPTGPESAPTEQIPRGSDGPAVPPVPPAPSHEAPDEAPSGAADPYAGSSAQPTDNPHAPAPPAAAYDPYAAPQPPYDPYAAPQPAHDPYAATGASAPQGGYPAYGAPSQWQAPPAAYGAPAPQNTSALVLTIISGIVTVSCCIPGIAPLILGIMALSKQSTDPEASRRLSRWGWIAFAIGMALVVIVVLAFIALGFAGVWDDGGYRSEPDFSY